MPMAEYLDWLAEYQLAPWGEEADDLRAAMVAQVTANSNGAKVKAERLFVRDRSDADGVSIDVAAVARLRGVSQAEAAAQLTGIAKGGV